jgi:hypothetical protein
MLDQVLFRPDLLPFFHNETLRILASDGTVSFLTDEGLPDRDRFSDHLPIKFGLDI